MEGQEALQNSNGNIDVNRKLYALYKQLKAVSSQSRDFHHSEYSDFKYSDLNNWLWIIKVFLILFNVGLFIYILYLMKRKFAKETILKMINNSQTTQLEEDKNTNSIHLEDDSKNEHNAPEKRVGIIISHPDDEAMFFTPIIVSLVEQNIPIHILCLSTGNVLGLGQERIRELERSCIELGVCNSNSDSSLSLVKSLSDLIRSENNKIVIVDHDELKDGMRQTWNTELIAQLVYKFVQKFNISTILTFDERGISDHPNHIATWNGVREFKIRCEREKCFNHVDVFQLETSSLIRKYLGVLDLIVSLHKNSDHNVTIFTPSPLFAWKAMRAHHSQFVWFRKLFVLFSRYTFVNTFTKLSLC